MMKNRGFTLVEVLAVIGILALLGALVTPVINSFVNNSRDTLYEQQVHNIKEAAKEWGAHNIGALPTSTTDTPNKITLRQLLEEGYFLEKEVKNPKTKRPLSLDGTYVTITYKSNGKLEYQVTIGE